jgi:hypothetical protein
VALAGVAHPTLSTQTAQLQYKVKAAPDLQCAPFLGAAQPTFVRLLIRASPVRTAASRAPSLALRRLEEASTRTALERAASASCGVFGLGSTNSVWLVEFWRASGVCHGWSVHVAELPHWLDLNAPMLWPAVGPLATLS